MQKWRHALAEALNSGLLYVYQALQCPMEALQGRGTLCTADGKQGLGLDLSNSPHVIPYGHVVAP